MRPEVGGDASMNPLLYNRAARILASCGYPCMYASPVAGLSEAGIRGGNNLVVTGFEDTCPVHPGVVLYMVAEDTGPFDRAPESPDASRMGWSYGVSRVCLVYPARALVIRTGNVPGDAGAAEVVGEAGCGWKDVSPEGAPSDGSPRYVHGVPELLRALVLQAAHGRSSEEAPAQDLAKRLVLAEKTFRRAVLEENPNETDKRLAVASLCMTLALLVRAASCQDTESAWVENGLSQYLGKLLGETDPWYCDIRTLRLPDRAFWEETVSLDPAGLFPLRPFPPFTVFRALNRFCMDIRGGSGYPHLKADATAVRRSVLELPVADDYVREISRRLSSDRNFRFLEIAEGPGALVPLIAWCLVAQDRLSSTHVPHGTDRHGTWKPASADPPAIGRKPPLDRIFLASPELCTVLSCRAFLVVLDSLYGGRPASGYEAGAWVAGTIRLCSPFVTRSWWDRHRVSFPKEPRETPPPSLSELFVQPENEGGFSSVLVTSGTRSSPLRGRDRAFLEENSAVYQNGAGVFQYFAEQALEKTAPGGHLYSLSPADWLYSIHGRQIRAQFARSNVLGLESFESGHSPRAEGDSVGMVLEKGPPGTHTLYSRYRYRRDTWVSVYRSLSVHPGLDVAYWSFEDRSVSRLRKKLEEAGTPLSKYCMGEVLAYIPQEKTGTSSFPGTSTGEEIRASGKKAAHAPGLRVNEGRDSPDPFITADVHIPRGPHGTDMLVTVRIPGRDRYLVSFLESSLASFYASTHPLLNRDLAVVMNSLPVRVPDLFDPAERTLYDAVLASKKRTPPGVFIPETRGSVVQDEGIRQIPGGTDDIFARLYGLTPDEAAVIRRYASVTLSVREPCPVFRKKRRRRRKKSGK